MVAKVQISVETKDNSSGVIRGITSQFGALGNIIGDIATQSVGWGTVTVAAGALVYKTLKDAVDETIKYNTEIHNLSLATGTGMEATSRLVQVLDDFGVSTEDVLTATRALTRQGLAPTIETLASLSDQYNSLTNQQAKNEFIIKNLGRAGIQWAEALSKGGDALVRMNAQVAAGLVASQQSYENAQRNVIAVDNWTEAWQAWKMEVGTNALPVLTDTINYTLALSEADKQLAEEGVKPGTKAWADRRHELLLAAQATQEEVTQARLAEKGLTDEGAAAVAAAGDYGKLLSSMQGLNKATKDSIALAGYNALKDKFQISGKGIDASEGRILENAGIQLGIFDANAVRAAHSIDVLSDSVDNGTMNINDYIARLRRIPTSINTTITTTTINKSIRTGGGGVLNSVTGGNAVIPDIAQATGSGGWQTVPSGYPNDTYLMAMSSGERYNVQTSGQAQQTNNGGGGAIHIANYGTINLPETINGQDVRELFG